MMKHLVGLALVASCTTVASQDIRTHGMSATIEVTADPSGQVGVGTTLYLGGQGNLDYIELSPGDTLVASAGGAQRTLTEIHTLGITRYSTLFPSSTPGETVEVALRRTADPGAPSSTVGLPAPFALAVIASPRSRAADLAIAWTGTAGDPLTWSIGGACIDVASGTIASDTGAFVVPAGTLVKARPVGTEQVPDACEAKLIVTRTRTGHLDPGFGAGGAITATQTRSLAFTTAP